MKNFLLISILAMTVVSFLPPTTYGSTTTEVEDLPHALPLTAEAQQTGEIWQEDDREVLIRSVRGAKNNNGANNGSGSGKKEKNKRLNNRKKNDEKKTPACRYEKSQWSECNQETNVRTRTLTLKKGDDCIPTRTIQKKCKKACRYDKGEWSKCISGSMTRKDTLRNGSDASCKPNREITKNCNKDKKQKKQDKNGRKSHA